MQQRRKPHTPAATATRRSLGAALLFLLVFQAGGWFFAWQWQWHTARAGAATALTNAATRFDTLLVAAAELPGLRVAGKKHQEIRVGGRLYDIAREIPRGDSIELVVYHDRDEERVLAGLAHKVAGGGQSEGATSERGDEARWARWLGAVYLPVVGLYRPAGLQVDETPRHFSTRQFCQQGVPDVPEKPPARWRFMMVFKGL